MSNVIEDRKNKKAIVIAPFFSSEMNANRPLSVASALAELSRVDIVTTDFDHWAKQPKLQLQSGLFESIVYLKTLPYQSNIGIPRLLSHIIFSIRAAIYFFRIRRQYDIVYVTVPFNLLAFLCFCSASHQQKVLDVVDIWPDVLPFTTKMKRYLRPAFSLWRWFFNNAVKNADVVLTVSDSFLRETLKYTSEDCIWKRFYIGDVNLRRDLEKGKSTTIVYVGNIGWLYDFETLLEAMSSIKDKSLKIFVIGEGERRNWLLQELNRKGISHQYFGVVHDPVILGEILSKGHIGFNGYVNTSASFSYKANTYFAAGLPILNSMHGDLEELVRHHKIGLNYIGGDVESLTKSILQLDDNLLASMSQNSARFFDAELDRAKIRREMSAFLRVVLDAGRS